MRRLWQMVLCILLSGMLLACQKPDTAVDSDKNTRLVWLAPNMPCEAGEPNFGTPNCYIQRKRDAVAVFRIPKSLNVQNFRESAPDVVSGVIHSAIIFDQNQVLIRETPGKFDEWLEKQKKIERSELAVREGELFRITGASWAVGLPPKVDRHAVAFSRMETGRKVHAEHSSHLNLGDMSYVQVASPIPGFTAYAAKGCIGHMREMKTGRGPLTEPHFCDAHERFYLPMDDKNSYVTCQAPFILDGNVEDGWFCYMESVFPIEFPGFKPGSIYFRMDTDMKRLKSGFWKHMNKRLEEWLKSLAVSQQELSRIKQ